MRISKKNKVTVLLLILAIGAMSNMIIRSEPTEAQTPTLMFTIMKGGECVTSVNPGETVNIRVHRTSGTNNITNITVNGANTGVTLGPAPINGQSITNVTLTQSTQFTVTGTNNGTRTFSPWCGNPTNGSAVSGYVTVSQGLTAIACSTKAYYAQGSPSNTSYLDLSQASATVQTIGTTTGFINGAGFNSVDGFFYGVKPTAPDQGTLYKFDEAGHTQNMGKVLPDSGAEYIAGDFINGYLYVLGAGGNQLFQIDVRPGVATRDRITRTIITSRATRIADVAYNPSDGMLYGFDRYNPTNSNRFVRINPSTGAVEDLSYDFPSIGSVAHGAAWFYGTDYYSYSNNGVIYKIENMKDYSSSNKMMSPPGVWKNVTAAASNSNDGIVCSAAVPPSCSIFATSYNITPGQSTKLYWSSNRAVSAVLTATGFRQNVAVRQDNPPGYPVTPSVATKYTLTVIDANGAEGTCNATITVQAAPDQPYFKITGNDSQAGSVFDDNNDGVCTTSDATATFKGFNIGTSPYGGSGAQFALLALGTIEGVASANLRTQSSTPSPKRETFANSDLSKSYGGDSGIGRCMPDYFATNPNTSGPRSTTVIPGVNLAGNDDRVQYVNGDAIITGNITYEVSSSDAPSFTLIVDGNIFISSSVTRLDGIYIAQDKTLSSTGVIYTCSLSNGSLPSSSALDGTCGNKLTINGALIARLIKPWRTNGSLLNPDTPANVAEEFNFSPELYLEPSIESNGSYGQQYDSYSTVAPIF